mgnify:CR=1 FL=1
MAQLDKPNNHISLQEREKAMNKILLVEDDPEISIMLKNFLTTENFEVITAMDGESACRQFFSDTFGIVLLDLMIPKISGIEVMNRIRENSTVPIIIISAKDTDSDKTLGLGLGADDYITKPFRPRELIARIGTALRKFGCSPSAFEMCGLHVDTASGIVKKDGREIFLSALEYRLLLIFINNPKIILTRDRLLEELWDAAGEFVNNNTLTVYIKRLREKIENDPANPQIILTVRGMGYRLGGSYVSE